jgi:hypothetical protein
VDLPSLDGAAGLAALLNSLLVVPMLRGLKKMGQNHEGRIGVLEKRATKRKRRW